MTRALHVSGAIAALVLAGCTVGPDYVRPTAPTPAAYRELTADWKPAAPRDHLDRGEWWRIFGDPVLDDLIARIDISNQNLRFAEAQLRQSRALAGQARAGYYPVLNASADELRSKPSSASRSTFSVGPRTNYAVGLDASWEPDLWGRVRRSVESSDANVQATAADVASARLLAQTELAQNYFLLRIAEVQQALLDDTVKAYETSLQLTRNRYAQGVSALVEVVQAETQLKSTQAQAIDVGVVRAQLEHAIAVLIGVPPADLSIPRVPLTASPAVLPPGVPSALLERRPDIAAAERRVAAANAQIGVAESAYFPSLTLAGAVGYQSSTWGNLFTLPARFWSVGPALAQVLFDGGLRKFQTEQARAAYDAEVALYRQSVLVAFQEVEDNLAALRILEEESLVQAEAVRAARESVALTTNQYKGGIVSYLNVIIVQAAQLNAERTAADLLGRRLAASVRLVGALGGGWDAESLAKVTER